jgi:LPXTG-site transpeptidase (sortase) family protein
MKSILLISTLLATACQAAPQGMTDFLKAKYGFFVHYVWGGKQGTQFTRDRDGRQPATFDEFANAFDAKGLASDLERETRILGLTAMIQEGTDARTLRRAVGHIPGTPFPGQQGNVVITGHRDTFFRPLHNIRKGDEITLTTLSGFYRYRVDSTEVVEPENTNVLADTDDAVLTLVTCYPFYFVGPAPKRFIVRAHMIPG